MTCCLWAQQGSASADGAVAADQTGLLSVQQIIQTDGPLLTDTGRQVIELSLQQCINRAMAHNFDVRIERLSPVVRYADVTAAQAAFDSTLFGSAQLDTNDSDNIATNFYNQTINVNGSLRTRRIPTDPFTTTHDDNYSAGLRKLLPTGATVQLAQQLRRYHDFSDDDDELYRNPFYEYALQFQLRQPLLRDFGIEVNRAAINASRHRYHISRQQLQLQIIRTLADVETAYWRLFFARKQMQIFSQLAARASKTLEVVRSRGNYDGSSISYSRTEAVMEKAHANIISARSNMLQQQEALLNSINDPNLPPDKDWEIIPSDKPNTEILKVSPAEVRTLAVQLRPEVIAQKFAIDISDLAVTVADNQRLPRLDLVYQQEMSGAGSESHSAWDQQWQNDLVSYSVGVSFELPIGNRAAEAEYLSAQTKRRQEKLRLQGNIAEIQADVNTSLHNLNNSYEEIAIRRQAVDADTNAVMSYLAIQDTQSQNSMTPEFLNLKLDADDRLTYSQVSAVQTMVQYDIAIMNLHRAQGTLLRYNNVNLADFNEPADKQEHNVGY
jgi:outer membrane protein TolC